jgi:hypothetical protein
VERDLSTSSLLSRDEFEVTLSVTALVKCVKAWEYLCEERDEKGGLVYAALFVPQESV